MHIKSTTKTNIVIATLSISLSTASALVPALSSIANAFPQWSQWIQLLITVPSLTMMVSSLLANRLLSIVGKKQLTITSLLVILLSGLLPYFVNSFLPVLLSRVFMGLGLGIINTISSSMPANEYPEGAKRSMVTGLQSAFSSFGGILFSVLSGWAATTSWKNVFLVQLVNVIPLFFVYTLMASDNCIQRAPIATEQTKRYFTKEALLITILSFFCIALTCTYPLNLSLYINAGDFGTTKLAGVLTSVNAFIGFFIGLSFSKVLQVLKEYTLAVGLAIAGAAMFIIGFASATAVFIVGSVLFGIGTSLVYPAFLTRLYKEVPQQHLIIGVSMFTVGSNLSQFFSPFIINPIASLFGGSESSRILVAAAGLVFVAALIMASTWRKRM